MGELIEELGFREKNDADKDNGPSFGAVKPLPKVLCVPVRDETDELGAIMLAQLLDSNAFQAVPLPISQLDDLMTAVTRESPDLVILSSLPPFALSRAHRIYRVMASRKAPIDVMIGLWGYADDTAGASDKFSREPGFRIITTLADAVAQVRAHLQIDGRRIENDKEGIAFAPPVAPARLSHSVGHSG